MKKSMGMEKKALARDVKNAMRAMAFDFSGIGVPLAALSLVHEIRRF